MTREPDKTREPQYQRTLELDNSIGRTTLGLLSNQAWHDDPRHVLFVMSRYKFVSKMLSGKDRVLEVGCGDAFFTRLVQQEVGSLCAVDFDPVFGSDINARMEKNWEFEHRTHDILEGPVDGSFDAAYALDVIEHIPQELEREFVENIFDSLSTNGVLIVGTPTIQSQTYASEGSKAGHVNCKDQKELRELMQDYFHNVFVFSMNDEVVHTGYYPMAHYMFAVCVGKKIGN